MLNDLIKKTSDKREKIVLAKETFIIVFITLGVIRYWFVKLLSIIMNMPYKETSKTRLFINEDLYTSSLNLSKGYFELLKNKEVYKANPFLSINRFILFIILAMVIIGALYAAYYIVVGNNYNGENTKQWFLATLVLVLAWVIIGIYINIMALFFAGIMAINLSIETIILATKFKLFPLLVICLIAVISSILNKKFKMNCRTFLIILLTASIINISTKEPVAYKEKDNIIIINNFIKGE